MQRVSIPKESSSDNSHKTLYNTSFLQVPVLYFNYNLGGGSKHVALQCVIHGSEPCLTDELSLCFNANIVTLTFWRRNYFFNFSTSCI